MSTLTDKDLTILESLDFEPACQSTVYHGDGEAPPAKWAVFMRSSQKPCGCSVPTICLSCDECKQVITSPRVHCAKCGVHYAPSALILRIEPLR